jgi:hypothetical protein
VAEFQIGARRYSSKAKATDAVRAVRDKYRPGETVTDPEDVHFIYDLLWLHPSAATKIGSGVHSFQVERNPQGTDGFWISRVDGTRTDFSFLECLTPSKHEQKVKSALRVEVRADVLAFKQWFFTTNGEQVLCALTGVLVAWDTCHVDHEPSFASLVKGWMAIENLTWDLLRVRPHLDGEIEERLLDPPAIESWVQYHRQHARLQIVSIPAHQGKSKGI